jgi:hypothetical protein
VPGSLEFIRQAHTSFFIFELSRNRIKQSVQTSHQRKKEVHAVSLIFDVQVYSFTWIAQSTFKLPFKRSVVITPYRLYRVHL